MDLARQINQNSRRDQSQSQAGQGYLRGNQKLVGNRSHKIKDLHLHDDSKYRRKSTTDHRSASKVVQRNRSRIKGLRGNQLPPAGIDTRSRICEATEVRSMNPPRIKDLRGDQILVRGIDRRRWTCEATKSHFWAIEHGFKDPLRRRRRSQSKLVLHRK